MLRIATVTLTLDEYEALRALIGSERESEGAIEEARAEEKPKRKPTAYNRAYSKAFKSIQGNYKLKSGSWAKNGFKNCCKAANKMCK